MKKSPGKTKWIESAPPRGKDPGRSGAASLAARGPAALAVLMSLIVLIILIILIAGTASLVSCDIVPAVEAPHSNILDPENPEFSEILPVAVLTGLPAETTYETSLYVTVGGEGIVSYKFSVDSSAYSEETEVGVPLHLSTILEPGSHTLSVVGKFDSGLWQWESLATTYTWTILELTDTEPPANIGITAFAGEAYVADPANPLSITWPVPDEYVLVLRGLSGPPSDNLPVNQTGYSVGEEISGFAVVYAGYASGTTDADFATDGVYYYRAYAYDEFHNYASGGLSQYIRVYKDAVYVHFNGNDMNSGLSSAPLETIQAGIDKAVGLGSGSAVACSSA